MKLNILALEYLVMKYIDYHHPYEALSDIVSICIFFPGASYLFGETFQTLWASVLLGMGIRLLGFEDDFFQALIF